MQVDREVRNTSPPEYTISYFNILIKARDENRTYTDGRSLTRLDLNVFFFTRIFNHSRSRMLL